MCIMISMILAGCAGGEWLPLSVWVNWEGVEVQSASQVTVDVERHAGFNIIIITIQCPKTYLCALICALYKSINNLITHNSGCIYKNKTWTKCRRKCLLFIFYTLEIMQSARMLSVTGVACCLCDKSNHWFMALLQIL